MKNYYYTLLSFVLFLFSCSSLYRTRINQDLKMSHSFPAAWIGYWSGTLDIYNYKGKSQSLPMEVEIAPIDSAANRYTFALIYGADKKEGRRAYELFAKDTIKGIYVNDEKNSIQMEEYLINNKLYCWFEVQGTMLLSTFELKSNNELCFEIISGGATPVSITGGQKVGGEDIPTVKTFPIKVVQKAILTRMNKKNIKE